MATSTLGRPDPSRRDILRRGVAAGAAVAFPTVIPASALGRNGVAAPSERINLGVIGIGPRCTYDLKSMLKFDDLRCVAVCDVQATRLAAAKQLVDGHYGNADCATHRDLRELLDRKDVDAVLIATGDRWHAPASILAARAGKDVYSEKPCAQTIALCQQVAEVMAQTGRIFQAGTQRRNVSNFQAAVKLAHDGKLGRLKTLYASVYAPALENSWLPGEPTPPREEVDWDLWLGPAPWRPYNRKYVEGGWRGYWDFESGARLLDWGAHTVDLCQWANQADDTMPVEYVTSTNSIHCRYANGVTLVLDFLKTPFGERPGWITELGTCPVRFVGEEGWVETGDNGGIAAHPASLNAEAQKLATVSQNSGLDVAAHTRDFLDAIRSRRPPACNAEVMRNSHIACHAASFAWILQRPMKLDPSRVEFLDDPEANGLRSRPAREAFRV